MEIPSTVALRPICRKVKDAIGNLPNGAFNFGLYFNKWFYVVDWNGTPPRGLKKKSRWSCPTSVDSVLERRHEVPTQQIRRLDNLNVSVDLFNGISQQEKWDRKQAEGILDARHSLLKGCAAAFRKLGYVSIAVNAELLGPLVTGLGNEHPTEKGFRFDWTLGIPVIPSSSIKGVVRLAFLVNKLNSFEDPNDPVLLKFCGDIQKDETFPKTARSIFGAGGDENALRGKVIFMDAYPEKLPRLKAEIMNCHYPDYLNKGERGPTEDQQPNPQRFWAVDPLDENGKKLKFVFRLLIHRDIANNQETKKLLLDAVKSALEEHGLGAKTAIGHGRFLVPSDSTDKAQGLSEPGPASKTAPQVATQKAEEHWRGADVSHNPGTGEFIAQWGNKKASTKEKTIVTPELLQKIKKKKTIKANVTVTVEGKNFYRILKIEPENR